MLLSLRQCARYLGVSHPMLCSYFLLMQREIPYVKMKGVRLLVDADFIEAKLRATGYGFLFPSTVEVEFYEEIMQDVYGGAQLVLPGDEHLALTSGIK